MFSSDRISKIVNGFSGFIDKIFSGVPFFYKIDSIKLIFFFGFFVTLLAIVFCLFISVFDILNFFTLLNAH
jgi:hypothetical protein